MSRIAFSRVGYTIRWTRSFFKVALKDSAHALSQHTPVFPHEARIRLFGHPVGVRLAG